MVKSPYAGPPTRSNEVLEAALAAARAGYPVFPVLVTVTGDGSKDVRPLGKWRQVSTTDPDQLRSAWSNRANAYGIDTGKAGLCVVDLDTHDGQDGVGEWAKLLPDSPEPVVSTPSGGQHVYFRDSTGELRNSAGKLAPGVDVRGNGGLVIGPGSVLPSGTYAGTLPRLDEVLEVPEELRALVRSSATPPKPEKTRSGQPLGEAGQGVALVRELLAVVNADGGTRNHQLNKSAFALGQIVAGGGLREDVVRAALEEAAREAGLDTDEIAKTVDSGFASARQDPRNVERTPEGLFAGLDLDEWFSRDHPAPPRFGLGELLYEGAVHIVAGEPASGKSVLCYRWAIDVMRAGKRAVLLDEEAGPRDALGKFVALGASAELLKDKLTYLEPGGRNLDRLTAEFHALVSSGEVGLVVVDSLGAALAIAGRSENDNGEVGAFLTSVILPLAERYGVAVLLIDHKTKGDVSRYSRGASVKLQLTGVQLNVVAVRPFSKGQNGQLVVECNKNRFGDYAQGDQWTVDVLTGNDKITLDVSERTEAQEFEAFVSSDQTRAVARVYRDSYPAPVALRNLEIPGLARDKARTIAYQLRAKGVLEYSTDSAKSPLRWVSDQTVLELPVGIPS